MNNFEYRWSDLAFSSKKTLRELDAIFLAPSRQMTKTRLTQIIKHYLPLGNLVIAYTDEPYIDGFDGQGQFRTLSYDGVNLLASKVNQSSMKNKITILHCHQADVVYIYEKVKFKLVLLVNGSWSRSFHLRPEYYKLVSCGIKFEYISPFASEEEAREFADNFVMRQPKIKVGGKLSEIKMLELADRFSMNSFDGTYQTGLVAGKKTDGGGFDFILGTCNTVTPYLTYAWHFGSSRERNLSQPGDLTYYDAVHAEVMLILKAQEEGIKLTDCSLFINLLPCPTCAKMICESDIKEVIYREDHSSGYAVAMLKKAGKKIRRVVDDNCLIKKEF